MKINLAVYTAQEGYSWQPGSVFTAEELQSFKKCMGKFPSPDSAEFPYGGVFLLEDRVVFYRYHVAKKIDFRGRDALYCILGAVPMPDARHVDPKALFACPEFAGPMKPFPTSLELRDASPDEVPEWLKNLDRMSLDVRITGPDDNPRYDVKQEPAAAPALTDGAPEQERKPALPHPEAQQSPVSPSVVVPTENLGIPPAFPVPPCSVAPAPVQSVPRWMKVAVAAFALLSVLTTTSAGLLLMKTLRDNVEISKLKQELLETRQKLEASKQEGPEKPEMPKEAGINEVHEMKPALKTANSQPAVKASEPAKRQIGSK